MGRRVQNEGEHAMEFDWKTWFMGAWENNRRLTNNVARALIRADAIDKVLVPGMRPFRAFMLEIVGMERWNVQGLAYDRWDYEAPSETLQTGPIEEVLEFGKKVREETRQLWPDIPFDAFTKMRPAPASYIPAGTALGWLTYTFENEIHHRGQGYVYLRLLGNEPPAFFNRAE